MHTVLAEISFAGAELFMASYQPICVEEAILTNVGLFDEDDVRNRSNLRPRVCRIVCIAASTHLASFPTFAILSSRSFSVKAQVNH